MRLLTLTTLLLFTTPANAGPSIEEQAVDLAHAATILAIRVAKLLVESAVRRFNTGLRIILASRTDKEVQETK